MKKEQYRVLVTASGTGEALGNLTKYTNKTLVKVGKKPAISYIIELYPPDTEFVITLGHFGDQVKNFLELVYPKRHFIFVPIDKYEGPGSSLSYSMLQSATHLDSPFIYHASDTIITQIPPAPKFNWIGGVRGMGSPHYASFDIVDNKIRSIYDKGMVNPDFLHIGLVGIHDHAAFWESKQRVLAHNLNNPSLGDTHAINNMIENGSVFRPHEIDEWYDTGNLDTLTQARAEIADAFHILDKEEESIFLFDTDVIKFFHDENMVKERVSRAKILKGLVPEIKGSTKNFYKYEYVKGQLYADVARPVNFRDFLEWTKNNLWKPTQEVDPAKFREVCYDFYHQKSLERLKKFFTSRGLQDRETIINDEAVPSVASLMKQIDFDWICTAEQSLFHGDFILDNIIKTDNGYVLLDWRQNFGGLLQAGDRYYDFAKLNHNLTISHRIIHDNLFTIDINGAEVTCDILRKDSHVVCQDILFEFLEKEGYDTRKVRLLTGLNWLNGAVLHHHPYDLFLFYFGKMHVWRALNES